MDISKKMLSMIKTDKTSRVLGYSAGISYFIVYLISIGNIFLTSKSEFSFFLVQDWPSRILQQKVAFLWEPIARLNLGEVSFFISIPNLILGAALGTLVALNILIAVFSYRLPKICNLKHRYAGVLGFLPATLTGFACCAPTFLIALGPLATAGASTYVIALRPFLIPLSILLMTSSIIWMLRKIPHNLMSNHFRRT